MRARGRRCVPRGDGAIEMEPTDHAEYSTHGDLGPDHDDVRRINFGISISAGDLAGLFDGSPY